MKPTNLNPPKQSAWTLADDRKGWRPNSRLFKIDLDALRAKLGLPAAAGASGAAAGGSKQHKGKATGPKIPASPAGDAGASGSGSGRQAAASLPAIQGGASAAQFATAYAKFWASQGLGAPPRCHLTGSCSPDPWQLWREVHSWGGPGGVTQLKLWKGIALGFNPGGCGTMLSTAIKTAFATCLQPLDEVRPPVLSSRRGSSLWQPLFHSSPFLPTPFLSPLSSISLKAIDAGKVSLERPKKTRLAQHRPALFRESIAFEPANVAPQSANPRPLTPPPYHPLAQPTSRPPLPKPHDARRRQRPHLRRSPRLPPRRGRRAVGRRPRAEKGLHLPPRPGPPGVEGGGRPKAEAVGPRAQPHRR
jgi:hypothetical protein